MRIFIASVCWFLFSLDAFASADSLRNGKDAFSDARYEDAIQIFLPLAEAGNVEAQFLTAESIRYWMLGWPAIWSDRYYETYLISLDYLQMAAFSGHPEAAWILGKAYVFDEDFHNRGVKQDLNRARFWMQKAADRGVKTAQEYLASYFHLHDKNEDSSILLYGSLTCSEWRISRKADNSTALEHYVQGFLNGHVFGTKENFWKYSETQTPELAFLNLDIICEKTKIWILQERSMS